MEIQKNSCLTGKQQFRYELLQWCGSVADAERANAFVMGNDESQYRRSYPNPTI